MSSTNELPELSQPTEQHEPLTKSKPEAVRTSSDNFSVVAGEVREDRSENDVAKSNSTETAVTSSVKDSGRDGVVADHKTRTAAPGSANSDGEHAAMTRDIERRASEHLAKRAAEMTSGEEPSGTSRHAVDTAVRENEPLPATPPPPEPPRKDKAPVKLEPAKQYDEKHPPPPNEETANDVPDAPQGTSETTELEIQTIMDQFEDGMGGLGKDHIMSPRLEKQQPVLVLPPRSSSLEPQPSFTLGAQITGQNASSASPLSPQGTGNSVSNSSVHRVRSNDQESIISGKAGSIYQPPPPSPDPEPALPFDFHRFLEQLRHKSADSVAKYLRSFLGEFNKKQWMVHEQVKIISDFLEFITKRMGMCDVWRTVSDAEFDNAREGMEKLVMNRLYSQTFSPAIPSALGSPRKGARNGRSAADQANPHGPGRRGQHQEDVERDEVIAQKIKIYGWVSEEHLDIRPIGDKGRKFLGLAQKELLKINTYRAPRDKVICVLNACKVIFGFLRNSKADQSADAFVPLLIYTVLRARPEHLVSNVQYIWRFRNQEKLGGEAGYYMSSLMGVVQFIENLDRTTLTITDEEFELQVEQAVSAIAEQNRADEYEAQTHPAIPTGPMQHLNEKSAPSRAEVTNRNSMDAERSSPRRQPSQRLAERQAQLSSPDDQDAVTGLLRTIQKPLSSIGRMFSDEVSNGKPNSSGPASTPLPGSTPRGLSPAPRLDRRQSDDKSANQRPPAERERDRSRQRLNERSAEDHAMRQANAEVAQAQRVRAQEHRVVVETLQSMFPNLDKEVIEDVVRAQEGNVGRAVDGCLALSG
ncbi:hypothetical protein DOTSEDRAFT_69029 [Dothistroma septosporum NZE10]|uniref:VPS9 domain-containing protein n=1 Tax=Dothistroma septosporum (strain NZE10 / CBS 128990) TaxID=675120 RepID=N1Q3T9_DOTSN|nr:hypothetical protein DOTSEDRAFT_69029 [Dothistroma septosporum NZE10]